jgi:CubicO group peptidase (beta-lactamase class C family)
MQTLIKIKKSLLLALMMLFGFHSFSNPQQNKLDSLITANFQDDGPGGFILIIKENNIVYQKHFGMADAEKGVPIDQQSSFNLASVAKHFTAYAILMLGQQGKLNVDDPVHKYIPDLPRYAHTITIRQLAHHTSGLASTDVLRLFANIDLADPWSQEDELGLIKRYRSLNFTPGDESLYSNAGYSLLARVIEKASGINYEEYLRENIFIPLGMNNTYVYDQIGKKIPFMAYGHQKQNGKHAPIMKAGDASYGGSNIFIPAQDMASWSRNFLKPGPEHKQIVNSLLNKSYISNDGDTINYSWGMYVTDYKGLKMVSHSGGDLGFKSRFLIFPDQQTIIFAAFNTESISERPIVMGIADLLLSEQFQVIQPKERIPVAVDSSILEKYQGTFRLPDGQLIRFELENDSLQLILPGAPIIKLYAENNVDFFIKDFNAQISFHKDESGDVNQLTWHQRGMKPKAIRTAEPRMPETSELNAFAGVFRQPDLMIDYTVEYNKGKLIVHMPDTFSKYLNIGEVSLTPAGDDYFNAGPLGMIHFKRNNNGNIHSMVFMDVGRIRNVEFIRN